MNTLKNILKISIPLLLAAVLLWYVLQKVDVQELFLRLAQANYYWVAVAILISIFSHYLRAARWQVMIIPLGYKPSVWHLFMAVMTGYFANIFLPRAGEFLRCVSINRTDKVPVNAAFGTVIAERAIDFISLLLLLGLSLVLEFSRFSAFFKQYVFSKKEVSTLNTSTNSYGILFLIVFIIAILSFFFFWSKILRSQFFIKVLAFAKGILEGIISIKDLKNRNLFIFQTVLIWVCYYTMTYLMFYALPATSGLSMVAGLVILIVGGLGMSAPVSGGIGPFHLMVAGALELFYGLSQKDGIAYAFVIHTSQMIMVIFIGGLLTVWSMLMFKSSKEIV